MLTIVFTPQKMSNKITPNNQQNMTDTETQPTVPENNETVEASLPQKSPSQLNKEELDQAIELAQHNMSVATIPVACMGVGLLIVGTICIIIEADTSLLSMCAPLQIVAAGIAYVAMIQGSKSSWLCTAVCSICFVSMFVGELAYRFRINYTWDVHSKDGATLLSLMHGIMFFISAFSSMYLFHRTCIFRHLCKAKADNELDGAGF